MNRTYELLMIVNPKLEEAVRKELVSYVESELAARGSITKTDVWGDRKLAYKINGSDTGHYLLYVIDTQAQDFVQALNKSFNLKKDVWRYMFTAVEA